MYKSKKNLKDNLNQWHSFALCSFTKPLENGGLPLVMVPLFVFVFTDGELFPAKNVASTSVPAAWKWCQSTWKSNVLVHFQIFKKWKECCGFGPQPWTFFVWSFRVPPVWKPMWVLLQVWTGKNAEPHPKNIIPTVKDGSENFGDWRSLRVYRDRIHRIEQLVTPIVPGQRKGKCRRRCSWVEWQTGTIGLNMLEACSRSHCFAICHFWRTGNPSGNFAHIPHSLSGLIRQLPYILKACCVINTERSERRREVMFYFFQIRMRSTHLHVDSRGLRAESIFDGQQSVESFLKLMEPFKNKHANTSARFYSRSH